MTNNDVRSLIQIAIKAIGGDGLCNPDEECGCGVEELAPCDYLNLSECKAAKWTVPKEGDLEYDNEEYRDGYYRVME